jgi:ankyrin repeat protein
MPSFSVMAVLRGPLVLLGVLSLTGCANYTPERLAYRDRLESGLLTPDDYLRFKTPAAQRALRSADVNEQMLLLPQRESPELLTAVTANDVQAVKALLALPGISVNATDVWGNTPLQLAAGDGNLEMVRMLLKAGADANGRGGAMSPLSVAALHGQTQVVQLLLRYHANVDQTDPTGRTPLWEALEHEQLDCAVQLLTHGANYRLLDAVGRNVLTLAVEKGNLHMLQMLLHQGVPVDLRDAQGHSALYWTDLAQREDLGALLRSRGADVNALVVNVYPGRPYNTRNYDE